MARFPIVRRDPWSLDADVTWSDGETTCVRFSRARSDDAYTPLLMSDARELSETFGSAYVYVDDDTVEIVTQQETVDQWWQQFGDAVNAFGVSAADAARAFASVFDAITRLDDAWYDTSAKDIDDARAIFDSVSGVTFAVDPAIPEHVVVAASGPRDTRHVEIVTLANPARAPPGS